MILVAKQYRGNVVESFHIGYAVAVNDKNEIIFSAGETEYPVFLQTAASPFQTAVLLESGAVEKFKLDDEDIAIACSSHNGEAFQTEAVANLLKKIGVSVDDLQCGVHPPYDKTSYEQLILQGRRATALHNNCSGVHAGMLAVAKAMDVALGTYNTVEHPVQKRIFEKIKQIAEKEKIPMEIDNCNTPTCFLPLFNLAQMYRKLSEGVDEHLQKIFHVMTLHPKHLAGKGRFDTDIVAAMHGRIVSKYGCEGVRGIGIRTDNGHIGLAVKVLSGSWKAVDSMSVAILKHLKLLDDEALVKLEKYEEPVIKSYSDSTIGRIRTEIVDNENNTDSIFLNSTEQVGKVIRTIFFDLGNVIVSFNKEFIINEFARVCGMSLDQVRDMAQSQLEKDFEKGLLSIDNYMERLYREAGISEDITIEYLIDFWQMAFDVIPEVRQLFPDLKKQVRLFLLSNTNDLHIRAVRKKTDILDEFDDLVLSYEVKSRKPEPSIYQKALAIAGDKPDECLFIDDLIENVKAAREQGIRSHQFKNVQDLRVFLEEAGIRLN